MANSDLRDGQYSYRSQNSEQRQNRLPPPFASNTGGGQGTGAYSSTARDQHLYDHRSYYADRGQRQLDHSPVSSSRGRGYSASNREYENRDHAEAFRGYEEEDYRNAGIRTTQSGRSDRERAFEENYADDWHDRPRNAMLPPQWPGSGRGRYRDTAPHVTDHVPAQVFPGTVAKNNREALTEENKRKRGVEDDPGAATRNTRRKLEADEQTEYEEGELAEKHISYTPEMARVRAPLSAKNFVRARVYSLPIFEEACDSRSSVSDQHVPTKWGPVCVKNRPLILVSMDARWGKGFALVTHDGHGLSKMSEAKKEHYVAIRDEKDRGKPNIENESPHPPVYINLAEKGSWSFSGKVYADCSHLYQFRFTAGKHEIGSIPPEALDLMNGVYTKHFQETSFYDPNLGVAQKGNTAYALASQAGKLLLKDLTASYCQSQTIIDSREGTNDEQKPTTTAPSPTTGAHCTAAPPEDVTATLQRSTNNNSEEMADGNEKFEEGR